MLHRFYQELGNLGGAKLLPRKTRLGSGTYNDSDGMRDAIYRQGIWKKFSRESIRCLLQQLSSQGLGSCRY